MNLHLLQQGYPITIIDSEMGKRQEYYRILGQYQSVSDQHHPIIVGFSSL